MHCLIFLSWIFKTISYNLFIFIANIQKSHESYCNSPQKLRKKYIMIVLTKKISKKVYFNKSICKNVFHPLFCNSRTFRLQTKNFLFFCIIFDFLNRGKFDIVTLVNLIPNLFLFILKNEILHEKIKLKLILIILIKN